MEERELQTAGGFSSRTFTLIVIGVVFLGILILLQGKGSFLDLSGSPRVIAGLPAPNFTFPALDGKMVSLSTYRGKVVLLNIWATWCPPCVEEMPSMEKLYHELKGEDFEILAVSVDALGAKAVAPFMKKYNLSFPALLDSDGTIQGLYGTTGLPESFIIDKEGNIVKKVIGAADWSSPENIRLFRDLLQKPGTYQ